MYKMEIVKKGRKWFEAKNKADEKEWKCQIEINNHSNQWTVGDVVEFEAGIEKDYNSYMGSTKVKLFPATKEGVKEIQLQQEKQKRKEKIEKYLSNNWMSSLNLEMVKEFPDLVDEYKSKKKVYIVSDTKIKIDNYIGYIKDNLKENRWYSNGEIKIKEWLALLKKYEEETKYISNIEDKVVFLKEQLKAKKAKIAETIFEIYNWNGAYTRGEIVRDGDKIGKVIKAWKYFEPDSMSLGHIWQDGAWMHWAKIDTDITKSELKTFLEEEERINKETQERDRIRKEENRRKKTIEDSVYKLKNYIQNNGSYPKNKNERVIGEIIFDDFNIYGGGYRVIVQDDVVWFLENNGSDGDNWSYNNIVTGGAGAIGHYAEIDETIRDLIKIIKDVCEI